MGRPIQKKWFGLPTDAGIQIRVNGIKFSDGVTSTSGYIIKQTGDTAYLVQDVIQSHAAEILFLANATSVGALNPGQCFINATPFGGSARPCSKIAQYRLSLYEADGTINDYSWSTVPAVAAGQADLVTDVEPVAPVNTVLPAITGTAQVGETLTTDDGTWTGDAPITYSYQWFADGVAIGGETTNSLLLGAPQEGAEITVTVTATNAAGQASATSAPTAPVIPAEPVNTVLPAITGTAQVGETLTTDDGTWTGDAPITYSYQWFADGVAIGGETTNSLLLGAPQEGAEITVTVTATNDAGQASATSAPTAPVTPA